MSNNRILKKSFVADGGNSTHVGLKTSVHPYAVDLPREVKQARNLHAAHAALPFYSAVELVHRVQTRLERAYYNAPAFSSDEEWYYRAYDYISDLTIRDLKITWDASEKRKLGKPVDNV